MKNIKIAITLLILLSILAGCSSRSTTASSEKTAEKGQPILYQNEALGLTLYQTERWKKTKERTNSKGLHMDFKENQVHAIISVVSSKNTAKSIEADLLKSVDHPKILSQSNTKLEFQSNSKEKMRILSYLKKKGDHYYIFSFVTPLNSFESQKASIQKFMDSVKIE